MRDTHFFKTTMVGGLFVLMPIVVLVVLVGEAFSLVSKFGKVVATQVPEAISGRLPLATILSVGLLVLLCFLLGRLVAPRADLSAGTRLERALLDRIPGYQLVRGIAMSIFGIEGAKSVRPALLHREEGVTEIVLMIEALPDRRHVVFMPECPAPFTGSLLIVEDRLLEELPVSTVAVAQIFSRWGGGTAELLASAEQQSMSKAG